VRGGFATKTIINKWVVWMIIGAIVQTGRTHGWRILVDVYISTVFLWPWRPGFKWHFM